MLQMNRAKFEFDEENELETKIQKEKNLFI